MQAQRYTLSQAAARGFRDDASSAPGMMVPDMRGGPARIAILVGMLVVGLLMVVDVAYLVTGSLEEFPTAEQEDKVRTVTTAIAVVLVAVEMALWIVFRRLRRA